MNNKVTILDYGMCNLLNVARAFNALDSDVVVTESAEEAARAERLVVPGVGAFSDSMNEISSRGFGDMIRDFVGTGRPFMGICVGMQMLFDASEEFGEQAGLGIIPGRVVAIPKASAEGERLRVPHIGWNRLVAPASSREWSGTLLDAYSAEAGPAVYFVHSFAGRPERESDRLADCIYGGHRICAAIQRENIVASQFHPERSAGQGLDLLRAFLAM